MPDVIPARPPSLFQPLFLAPVFAVPDRLVAVPAPASRRRRRSGPPKPVDQLAPLACGTRTLASKGQVAVACDASFHPDGSAWAWFEPSTGAWAVGLSDSSVRTSVHAEAHALAATLAAMPRSAAGVVVRLDCKIVARRFAESPGGAPHALVADAAAAAAGLNASVSWVRGHHRHEANRVADRLANWARRAAAAGAPLNAADGERIVRQTRRALRENRARAVVPAAA